MAQEYVIATFAIEVPDGCDRHDVYDAVRARLTEVYVDGGNPEIPQDLRVAVNEKAAVDTFLAAAEVGLEGRDDDDPMSPLGAVDYAWQILEDLRQDGE